MIEHYPRAQLKIVGWHGSLPIQFHVLLSDSSEDSALVPFYKGNYVQYLKSQLSPSVMSHVTFAGSIPQQQLVNFYREADVFVFPSMWNEPFGMPIIEAMATGVPVVATRGGGIPELIIDGETGLLVERGDAKALADAIIRLLSDEELRKSMGKAARKRAIELFSWERIVENLLNQYKKICEGHN